MALAVVMGLLFLLQISGVILARLYLNPEAYARMAEVIREGPRENSMYIENYCSSCARIFSGLYSGDLLGVFLFDGSGANALFLAVFAGIYLWKTKKQHGLPFFVLETAMALFFLCYAFGHDSMWVLFYLAALCAAAGFFLCRSPGEPLPPFLLAAVVPASLMLVFQLLSCGSRLWFLLFLVLLTDAASFSLWKRRKKDLLPFLLCEGNLFFFLMLYSRAITYEPRPRLAFHRLQLGCGASWISFVVYGLLAASVLFFLWREWELWKKAREEAP